MCGIVGWIDWKRDLSSERATIEAMTKTLYWRGPDQQAVWVSPTAAIGHRRLIVIDPDGGVQPMVYEESRGRVVLAYNGEIYNFQELRQELQSLGHRFKTRSDTEVVLRGYLQWGEELPKKLNGIFAFAVWDERNRELLLVRDHLGVKPLFYAQIGESVFFASEMKALFAHPDINPEVDAEGLAELFVMGVRTPGHAVYRGIKEVLPGQLIRFTQRGKQESIYWELQSKPHTDDLKTTYLHIRELLKDTVKRQLVADMPVVSLLSGGLDSSGIAAIAAEEYRKQGKEPLRTFSVDFVNSERDFKENLMHRSLDTPWVKRVSEHAKTDHQLVIFNDEDLIQHLSISYRARDLPGSGNMDTSLYLLFKEMKKSATVALSGESADEVFGGYIWFHMKEMVEADTFPWAAVISHQDEPFSYLSEEMKKAIRPEEYIRTRYLEALQKVPRLDGEEKEEARMREVLYLNQKYFLLMLLERKDRMSMATGLEVRVPFCDYRLVEYVWNIPWKMKCVDEIEKGILRRAFADVLPHDVLYRRKSPYPSTYSPTYLQLIRDRLSAILNDAHSPLLPLVSTSKLRDFLKGIQGQEVSFQLLSFIERLIQIDSWMREYKVKVVL
jgi:asparagine synthase (glutamine-hydrolysing)